MVRLQGGLPVPKFWAQQTASGGSSRKACTAVSANSEVTAHLEEVSAVCCLPPHLRGSEGSPHKGKKRKQKPTKNPKTKKNKKKKPGPSTQDSLVMA